MMFQKFDPTHHSGLDISQFFSKFQKLRKLSRNNLGNSEHQRLSGVLFASQIDELKNKICHQSSIIMASYTLFQKNLLESENIANIIRD